MYGLPNKLSSFLRWMGMLSPPVTAPSVKTAATISTSFGSDSQDFTHHPFCYDLNKHKNIDLDLKIYRGFLKDIQRDLKPLFFVVVMACLQAVVSILAYIYCICLRTFS